MTHRNDPWTRMITPSTSKYCSLEENIQIVLIFQAHMYHPILSDTVSGPFDVLKLWAVLSYTPRSLNHLHPSYPPLPFTVPSLIFFPTSLQPFSCFNFNWPFGGSGSTIFKYLFIVHAVLYLRFLFFLSTIFPTYLPASGFFLVYPDPQKLQPGAPGALQAGPGHLAGWETRSGRRASAMGNNRRMGWHRLCEWHARYLSLIILIPILMCGSKFPTHHQAIPKY